jgi:mannose/fructose/N-acetylgalactosamine-specific phosphotransferase system component IIB
MQQTEWQQQANPERQVVVTDVVSQETLRFLLLTTEAPIRPEHGVLFLQERVQQVRCAPEG